jgi:hypothetical protein
MKIDNQIDTTNHVPVPERRLTNIIKKRFQTLYKLNPLKIAS